MRRLLVLPLVALAGCGSSDAPQPSSRAVAVPDGGVRAGHGAPRASVPVPERDASPPLAIVALSPGGGAEPVVHRSPVRPRRAAPVTLAGPEVRATALIRDPEGTGRIRLTVKYVAECAGTRRPRVIHRPPAQIERIRLAPGVQAPVERRRSERIPLPAACRVEGEAFADATNALGLESFSDPVRFVYDEG